MRPGLRRQTTGRKMTQGKSTCHQARCPEFSPHNTYGGERELIPQITLCLADLRCGTHMPTYMHAQVNASIFFLKKRKKTRKDPGYNPTSQLCDYAVPVSEGSCVTLCAKNRAQRPLQGNPLVCVLCVWGGVLSPQQTRRIPGKRKLVC